MATKEVGGEHLMFNRRFAATLGTIALVLAACTGGGDRVVRARRIRARRIGARRLRAAAAGECNVGVSWNNFEQPRWAATDKPNLQATIEAGGGTYKDFDAKLDSAQQLTDVETLINGGADVLVLLAQDQDAAVSALELRPTPVSRSSPMTA